MLEIFLGSQLIPSGQSISLTQAQQPLHVRFPMELMTFYTMIFYTYDQDTRVIVISLTANISAGQYQGDVIIPYDNSLIRPDQVYMVEVFQQESPIYIYPIPSRGGFDLEGFQRKYRLTAVEWQPFQVLSNRSYLSSSQLLEQWTP